MKRYFIHDGKINVRITEWGSRHAPVIFCLHGLGSIGLSFIEIAENLKEEYRIVAIDAPGHGKTDLFLTEEEYELPHLANWLADIIELLHIDQFFFLSHSWGSFISLFYLAQHPEKVKGTVLIDGGYQTKRLKKQSMQEEAAYYEKDFEEYAETWERFLSDAVYGDVARRSALLDVAAKDLVFEKNNRFYWHARGATGSNVIKGMHKHETADIYGNLPSDILLLRAALPEAQAEYRELASSIFEQKTGGTVKVMPYTTHMLHWDEPELVAGEIRKRWPAIN